MCSLAHRLLILLWLWMLRLGLRMLNGGKNGIGFELALARFNVVINSKTDEVKINAVMFICRLLLHLKQNKNF